MITRRSLLKSLVAAAGFTLLPIGRRGWALASPEPANSRLIVVLMRGAVDGLNVVTPYAETNYYSVRSGIAMAPPNQGGLVDLDGFFGLNPSLASLMPLWSNRTLAFIHASGSPAITRSHFEAQDILETAMLNTATASQGWMNGLAQAIPGTNSSMRALSVGNTLPKIFQGRYNVATLPSTMQGGHVQAEDPHTMQAFNQLYGNQSQLGGLYQQAVSSRTAMSQDLEQEMTQANRGAPTAEGFARQTAQVAALMRKDPGIQLVFMDAGGWDTHVNQGNIKGQLSGKLENFGYGLATLASDLGPVYQSTAILVMSEFGRTVAENGNGGTDHGHGNVAWLMGGAVRGGKVWGEWPGLNQNQLYEGRDLAVTTDFRSVIGSVLYGQFGMSDGQIASVVSGYQPNSTLRGLIG